MCLLYIVFIFYIIFRAMVGMAKEMDQSMKKSEGDVHVLEKTV